jgi:type IV pilus assembly protein PilB
MYDGILKPQGSDSPLGERLISDGVIDEVQLEAGLKRQEQTGAFLGETLVEMGIVQPAVLGPYLETPIGYPFVELTGREIDLGLARTISERIARRKLALPFALDGDTVCVAMADPMDLHTVDTLRATLKRPIAPYLAFTPDLIDAINRAFDVRHKAQSALEDIPEIERAGGDLSVDELMGLAEDAPIVRLVNSIVQGALANGASDIHIEPQEHEVVVRYRLDGLLYEQMVLPRNHLAAVVSRVKIMSRMNIAERRRPQDGRFSCLDENNHDYDLRVSVMPTIYGEKVVMRVLEKTSSFSSLEHLGFYPEQLEGFKTMIQRPHGIVLVTGPTGSGKSTTLYAGLNRINSPTLNINTIEDPVEYHLKGINQVQVNPKIGVTFASGLRNLVRQDPDVIMVGEIRDVETAEIAIQAALTGHLVLSTLHTNDAPGALVRLQNMGVEPFLISSAVLGVVGQRLVRTICPNCRQESTPSPEVVAALGLSPTQMISHGEGCGRCGNRGMKGRTAAYEVMPMTDRIREMVLARASGVDLKSQAMSEGMSTMRESGIRKVREGTTTAEEVMRVLFTEE